MRGFNILRVAGFEYFVQLLQHVLVQLVQAGIAPETVTAGAVVVAFCQFVALDLSKRSRHQNCGCRGSIGPLTKIQEITRVHHCQRVGIAFVLHGNFFKDYGQIRKVCGAEKEAGSLNWPG